MSGGFQFVDIILFALVAAFLILRLRSVLGRRDGHQGPAQDPFRSRPGSKPIDSDVARLPDRGEPAPEIGPQGVEEGRSGGVSVESGVTQIKIADPKFREDEFLAGAKVAFETILTAYAAGDTAVLGPLLSQEVFANFSKSIEDRKAAGRKVETTLVGIDAADIVEASMAGRMAHITVKFESQQIAVVRDEAGAVIEGDPGAVTTVTDQWTFARDTRSADPNWTLVATGTPDS